MLKLSKGKYLYHYTSFEAAIKIIASGSLLFSDIRLLNDINESSGPLVFSSSEEDNKRIAEILKGYAQISLSQDDGNRWGYDIPAMWGHYASKGHGVCLVFLKSNILNAVIGGGYYLKEVSYTNSRNPNKCYYDSRQHGSAEEFINRSKDCIFFCKTRDWSYEQEYRIIGIADQKDGTDLQLPGPLHISESLVAAILYNKSHEDFLHSVEYKALSKYQSKIQIFRYPSFTGHRGQLLDKDENDVGEPPLKYDFSQSVKTTEKI